MARSGTGSDRYALQWGGSASAASTTYNTRNVYLDGIPVESDADACTARSPWPPTRTPGPPHHGYYQQTSGLAKPGSTPAALNDPNQLPFPAGQYTFGSLLDPHF